MWVKISVNYRTINYPASKYIAKWQSLFENN